jgi:hypothetical protein
MTMILFAYEGMFCTAYPHKPASPQRQGGTYEFTKRSRDLTELYQYTSSWWILIFRGTLQKSLYIFRGYKYKTERYRLCIRSKHKFIQVVCAEKCVYSVGLMPNGRAYENNYQTNHGCCRFRSHCRMLCRLRYELRSWHRRNAPLQSTFW